MGKKRVIKKTTEELFKEREGVEEAVRRAAGTPRKISKKLSGPAIVHVRASYNNVLLSLCDDRGNVLAWASSGSIGFTGSKKSTPFAASRVAEALAEKAKALGVSRVFIFVKGIGNGRESAIRSLATHGIDIVSIKDMTPIPHNGPRPPKPRRV